MYQIKVRTAMATFVYIGGIPTWHEAIITMYSTPGALGILNLETDIEIPFGPAQYIKALSIQYDIDLTHLASLKPCRECGFEATCRAENPEAPGELMEWGSACVFE